MQDAMKGAMDGAMQGAMRGAMRGAVKDAVENAMNDAVHGAQARYLSHPERGATLLLTLLLLLVSLLSISSAGRSALQERMVVAQRDGDIAFEMAEAALREAERRLRDGSITLSDFNESGPYYRAGSAPDPFDAALWQKGSGAVRAATETGEHWSKQVNGISTPLFFIEWIGDLAGPLQPGGVTVSGREDLLGHNHAVKGFRVVAQARGATGYSSTVLEATIGADLDE